MYKCTETQSTRIIKIGKYLYQGEIKIIEF